ncbi:hypothetical protein J2Z21_007467 [Streptomyces griseochromogenes]|uniref:DUF397 domain-containing protein n=1 Tax=Streptomyces griseochromogenes TaxID=68214 RepID=A0A1B1B906_9ACTN|nr:DUF397 domain-containing protein [Streptomyces griseochromogenes]ANP55316.1 hypothetical protein AVL59_42090 [Streptomyces griseochromogenes]MBP2054462.1 hypothetical protein [Streptomyces griseochromogenes]
MSAASQPSSKPSWFKSSYSGGNATECVEAAFISAGVLVRDSKAGSGPVVAVQGPAWHAFSRALRKDQFEGEDMHS